MDPSYSWYGLNNIYNGMLAFYDYELVKKDWVEPSAYWSATYTWYGMTSNELYMLMTHLEW